ncbi:ABC transporter permease [Streptomyces sp. CAU 1734]|uniref:ABC transporter permease n=1 Tax=Streptomyces sp. CAU 1734 TaxID=3140360 RepID=UPI0032601D9D
MTAGTRAAVRAGLRRGRIEFRQTMTSAAELMAWLWIPVVALVVMYAFGDGTVPGTDISPGSRALPGILAMQLVFTGLMGLAASLTMDREDGTLLRARATPRGMTGYLIGKVVSKAAVTVSMVLILLIPAPFLFDGLELAEVSSWVTLVGILALGLPAVLPIGAILGSLFENAQSLGLVTLFITLLVVISGVFHPITAMPGWVQFAGQLFPLYWLGLGLRSALLPDALAAAEIGDSWRHLETAAVLGGWAAAGFLVAPVLLRRMTRRESGTVVAARRAKATQRMS